MRSEAGRLQRYVSNRVEALRGEKELNIVPARDVHLLCVLARDYQG